MKAKTARPNREAIVLDVEGGLVSARDIKAAREVAESAMSDKEFQRLANRIIDEARDGDASLTRAARDRDRATPRDLSREPSPRLRGELPALGAFRQSRSGRQRKLRSAAKNRVIAAAPTTQRQALRRMLIESDPTQWGRVNAALHQAGGQTIAESEDSAVVFGMPQELIKLGGAAAVLPAGKVAGKLLEWVGRASRRQRLG